MKKLTLVILAAGMGSRYGSLKQMIPYLGRRYDHRFLYFRRNCSGFFKVVFIIRKDFKEAFKRNFDKKLKGKVAVVYLCQELNDIPKEFFYPNRKKPWGTGHAMLVAREVVKENFAVINADDYYGKEAYVKMAKWLHATDQSSSEYCMIGYPLSNTTSEHGSVSRGQCLMKNDRFLEKIIERTHIKKARVNSTIKIPTGIPASWTNVLLCL